ncbi:MAG TPA: hypothetical protein H9672_01540 [Firmicutes bacterium]|nr:hypothetical protein [Bacillota bacterium]
MKDQTENKLIIRPVKRGRSILAFIPILYIALFCTWAAYTLVPSSAYFVIFLDIFGLSYIRVRGFIVYEKIIILTPDGCTIVTSKTQKKYNWDQLKTKQWEDYRNFERSGEGYYFQGGLFLSPYHVRQKYRTYAHTYVNHLTMHPFASVYIYFKRPEEIPLKTSLKLITYYEADEQVLRDTLNRWGVEIKEN